MQLSNCIQEGGRVILPSFFLCLIKLRMEICPMKKKYLDICQSITEQIRSGRIKPETYLPSENEMVKEYQASRETIRKALNLLAQNGYIQKIRGKGSMVLNTSKFDFPVSGLVSFKELAGKMSEPPQTILNGLSLGEAGGFIKKELQLEEGDLVWDVLRIRKMGGERIILDRDFLAEKHVPHLTGDICRDSIYQYLEKELNLNISFAKKEIIVEEPTDEDRSLLDLDGFQNVVVIRSHVYLNDASLFQFTESRHRPDKFRFTDFARRALH